MPDILARADSGKEPESGNEEDNGNLPPFDPTTYQRTLRDAILQLDAARAEIAALNAKLSRYEGVARFLGMSAVESAKDRLHVTSHENPLSNDVEYRVVISPTEIVFRLGATDQRRFEPGKAADETGRLVRDVAERIAVKLVASMMERVRVDIGETHRVMMMANKHFLTTYRNETDVIVPNHFWKPGR